MEFCNETSNVVGYNECDVHYNAECQTLDTLVVKETTYNGKVAFGITNARGEWYKHLWPTVSDAFCVKTTLTKEDMSDKEPTIAPQYHWMYVR